MTTADKLQSLRQSLDWSQDRMANELGLSGEPTNRRWAIHEMEIGKRAISGPIAKLIDHIAEKHGIVLERR